jgi:hypothetical protein
MRSKADVGQPTDLDSRVFDLTTGAFIPCRISRSILPIAGSAVTKRASRVSSRIFVHQDYRAALLRKELSTSDGHHQRMSVSVVACPRFEPIHRWRRAPVSLTADFIMARDARRRRSKPPTRRLRCPSLDETVMGFAFYRHQTSRSRLNIVGAPFRTKTRTRMLLILQDK